MTDNEIIKCAENCTSDSPSCGICLYNDDRLTSSECMGELMKDLFDLTNRQKAEIERLQKLQKPTETSGFKIENGKVVFYTNILNGYRHEYKDLVEVVKELNLMLQSCYKCDEVVSHYKDKLQTAKSEAIKEFAEKLTDRAELIKANAFNSRWAIWQDDIDKLVKEMTEVQK